MLQEPGVDLHLAGQHRLERVVHVVPGRDLGRPDGQLGVGGDDPQLLLAGEDLLPQPVPALVEAALVPVRPLGGDMVGGVGGPEGEVDEERLVGHQRLLLTHPVDRPVGHVLGEVIALLGGPVGLHRHGVLVDRRGVLVGLGPDEAVEVLEAPAAGRPGVEGAHRAGLPHRHLVALAELGRRVAVQLQDLGQGGAGVGPHRAVPGRRGGQLGQHAHPDRVMVAAGQQRLPGRGAQRGGVEPVVLQAARGQPLSGRGVDRPAERRGGAEPDVVQQHHQHVGRPGGRPQWLDRREPGRRVLGVVGDRPGRGPVRDRQRLAANRIVLTHRAHLI